MYSGNHYGSRGSGSYGGNSYNSSASVPLPPGMNAGGMLFDAHFCGYKPFLHKGDALFESACLQHVLDSTSGAIIGKGGSNIKLLSSRSGARVFVNSDRNTVEISESATAVEKARQMLQKSRSVHFRIMVVPTLIHSKYTTYSLPALAVQALSSLRLDQVTAVTRSHEQLYVMVPPQSTGGYCGSGADDLADTMSGLRVGAGSSRHTSASSSTTTFLLPSQQQDLLATTTDAVQKAISHAPRFDDIKIRFSFGKNFFYKGPSSYTTWTLQQLQAKKIPTDMKSVFSNAVTARQQSAIEMWLKQQGFRPIESKKTVTVHLKHRGAHAAYAMSFVNNNGSLTLRKLKSGNTKLAFGTLLCGPDSPDWRYKVLAQYQFKADPEIKAMLNNLASSTSISGGYGRSCLHIPGLTAADMINDLERHKQKTIWIGTWPAGGSGYGSSSSRTEIKVTLTQMTDGLTGQRSLEATGPSPSSNALLQQQQYGSASKSSRESQQLQRHMDNVMAFAKAAVASMQQKQPAAAVHPAAHVYYQSPDDDDNYNDNNYQDDNYGY